MGRYYASIGSDTVARIKSPGLDVATWPSNYWLRAIASLEIVGGISGLYNLWGQLREPSASQWIYLLATILGITYVVAVIAGVLLWRANLWGYRLSTAIQLIQLPKILGAHFTFMVSLGFDAALIFIFGSNLSDTELRLTFKVGADHAFFINYGEIPLAVGFSLVSSLFLFILFKCKRR